MCKRDQNGTLVDHFPSRRSKLMVAALIFLPSSRGQGETPLSLTVKAATSTRPEGGKNKGRETSSPV
ncbi:hypothetical protein NC653_024539 [Populus alba x Populus x berolinensis]|uniref:Uncharacterized protein n=1 Tax=Populus alba x Populus x berolinensis TaxID=444605 RepID=A0AAD6M8Z1_9ROSI|nr:hypothetical protein NC653_024539 [Populus alba x Populus x berolinensis]